MENVKKDAESIPSGQANEDPVTYNDTDLKKQKKSFYKKWWFWAIIAGVILIIGIIVSSMNGNDNTNDSKQHITFDTLSMDIPSYWIYDESVSTSNTVYYKEYDDNNSMTGMLYLMKHPIGHKVDITTDFNNLINGLEQTDGVHDMQEPSDIKNIDGFNSRFIKYQQDVYGQSFYVRSYAIAVGNDIITLTYCDENSAMADFEIAIDSISINYIETEPVTQSITETTSQTTETGSTVISEGTYKVGSEIPAGEYKLTTTTSVSGYYAILKDSSGTDNIIANDNFDNQSYVTVKDGQYLELNRCKAEKID